MTWNSEIPGWRIYERVVACFEIERSSSDVNVSVTPNALLLGSVSGIRRQIDILVDARFDSGTERRIIIDTKWRHRKLDVQDVDGFVGLMHDVQASRGVLVCTSGWSAAAKRRADKEIDLRLVTKQEAIEFDYAAIDPCPQCHVQCANEKGFVFWDGQFSIRIGASAVVFTGKCDVCRSFAFSCWECGEQRLVPDGVVHVCGCHRRWFTDVYEDDVIFVVGTEIGEIPLDRRPA